MHSSTVQGHLVMDLVAGDELSVRIAVDLGYDTEDPYAVRFTFHLPGDTPVTWYFARELLVDGISRPAGEGDVHIHPIGEDLTEIGVVLRSPDGDATLHAPAPPSGERRTTGSCRWARSRPRSSWRPSST